jgi:hypothetical protein
MPVRHDTKDDRSKESPPKVDTNCQCIPETATSVSILTSQSTVLPAAVLWNSSPKQFTASFSPPVPLDFLT